MSKTVFNTITIRIPADQIFITKKGTMTIVPTLTKSNAITKRLGIPAIILKKDQHILHPVIEHEGDIENVEEIKERQKKLKSIKKKIEKTIPKKKNIKEGFKFALSQLPKKIDEYDNNTFKNITKEYKKLINDLSEFPLSDEDINEALKKLYDLKFDTKITSKKLLKWLDEFGINIPIHDAIQIFIKKEII